jgi:hypothetical protein
VHGLGRNRRGPSAWPASGEDSGPCGDRGPEPAAVRLGNYFRTGNAATGSAAPSATRRQRNHVRKIIAKPYVGNPHVRIERGMGDGPAQAPRPDYQWISVT